ncbi:MAG: Lrp/AsnC ligand binding domain-containing protein [Thermoplasmata archaeon]
MSEGKVNEEYEKVLSSYYEGRGVSSIISIKVDTKQVDVVAEKLSESNNIEDVFLVTGDVDLVIKARFKDYDHMKKFLLEKTSSLTGIEDVKSMMVITTYKERFNIIDAENSG